MLACTQERCEVTLSDHPRAVRLLRKNAVMNEEAWKRSGSKVRVVPLDWCDLSSVRAQDIRARWIDEGFDIVCASDVMYCPELFDPLVTILSDLLRDDRTCVYLAYEERKLSMEKDFFRKFKALPHIIVNKVPPKELHPDYQSPELHLYMIKRWKPMPKNNCC